MRLYDTLEMLMVMYLLINDGYLQNLMVYFLKDIWLKSTKQEDSFVTKEKLTCNILWLL